MQNDSKTKSTPELRQDNGGTADGAQRWKVNRRPKGWSVEPSEDEDSGTCAWQEIAEGDQTVAIAVDSSPGYGTATPRLDARANLIAAAPDLLEALKEMVASGKIEGPKVADMAAYKARYEAALRAARSAIQRAEGGQ